MLHSKWAALALLAVVALGTTGCAGSSRATRNGALIGSVLGGVAGYQVGKHNSHRTKGTAIGAVVGGLAGAAIGDSIDDERRARAEESYTYERRPSYQEHGARVEHHTYEEVECDPEPEVIVVEREVPVVRKVIVRERHVPVRRRVIVRRYPRHHHHHHHHYRR